MKRRVRLTSKEFQELIEAREWCVKNDFTGFVRFYDDLLSFHHKRGALPPEAYGPEEEGSDGVAHLS